MAASTMTQSEELALKYAGCMGHTHILTYRNRAGETKVAAYSCSLERCRQAISRRPDAEAGSWKVWLRRRSVKASWKCIWTAQAGALKS